MDAAPRPELKLGSVASGEQRQAPVGKAPLNSYQSWGLDKVLDVIKSARTGLLPVSWTPRLGVS
jgi:hypothetical protein